MIFWVQTVRKKEILSRVSLYFALRLAAKRIPESTPTKLVLEDFHQSLMAKSKKKFPMAKISGKSKKIFDLDRLGKA
jgi:hypothetical protein